MTCARALPEKNELNQGEQSLRTTTKKHRVGIALLCGELYLDGGKLDKANNNLKRAEGMFQEMGMDYWSARTKEVMERL